MDIKKTEIISRFSHLLKYLLNNIAEQTIEIKIFNTCLDIILTLKGEKFMIEEAGKFFYTHRNEVKTALDNMDPTFFLEYDFKDQMKDWLKITKGYGENIAIGIRHSIQNGIKSLHQEDPQFGHKIFSEISSLYFEYLIICKSEEINLHC